MFSGIGGFELGINQAFQCETTIQSERQMDVLRPTGDSTDSNSELRNGGRSSPVCVGYSEIDKYAIATYQQHFGGHRNYGDATKINARELPDFDLLVGGFPCQAFSVAGKRLGFNDTRGTLFFDIARILSEKRPRHLVLENVKGLLSHDSGKTFQTIIGVLTDLGYFVEWQVLNSKDFGVPQNRERVFIVGHLGGEPRRKVFPITGDSIQDIGEGKPVFSTLRATYPGNWNGDYLDTDTIYGQAEIKQLNQPKHSNDRVYADSGVSPTLNTMQGGNRQLFIEQTPRIRRLTPLECERLQGFPDNFTIGSDTQRYKQCGNAVTVNVVEAVMRGLYE